MSKKEEKEGRREKREGEMEGRRKKGKKKT